MCDNVRKFQTSKYKTIGKDFGFKKGVFFNVSDPIFCQVSSAIYRLEEIMLSTICGRTSNLRDIFLQRSISFELMS